VVFLAANTGFGIGNGRFVWYFHAIDRSASSYFRHCWHSQSSRVDQPIRRRTLLAKKLYVGNLGYGVTNPELQEMFAAFGAVQSAEVITDRDTGRSKGFGFVEMSSDEEAQAAINGLNGKDVQGRPLTVNEARPREERRGGGGGGGGGRKGGGYGGGGGGGRGGYGGGGGGGGGGRRY